MLSSSNLCVHPTWQLLSDFSVSALHGSRHNGQLISVPGGCASDRSVEVVDVLIEGSDGMRTIDPAERLSLKYTDRPLVTDVVNVTQGFASLLYIQNMSYVRNVLYSRGNLYQVCELDSGNFLLSNSIIFVVFTSAHKVFFETCLCRNQ